MRLAAAAATSPADAGAADAADPDATDADVDVDGAPATDSAIGWLAQAAADDGDYLPVLLWLWSYCGLRPLRLPFLRMRVQRMQMGICLCGY